MAPTLLQAAALALRAASTTCPTLPTCPQDDQCSYTANGVSFQVNCATDYYGGDLGLAYSSTLAACMNVCSISTRCVAASYVGGNCYLKSALNPADANSNVIGVAVTSREIPTATAPVSPKQKCPQSFTCPENDGCSYVDGSRTLTLSCGMDFYGGDFANRYTESLEACTQACAASTECVAASFVGGKGAGTCYLKSTKNNGNVNDNVNGVYVVTASAGPSPSATPVTSTAVSSTLSDIVSSTEPSTGISSSALSTSIVQPSSSSDAAAVITSIPTATMSSTGILSSTLLSSTDALSPSSQAIPSSSSALSVDSSRSITISTTDTTSTRLSTPSLIVSSVTSTATTSTPEVTSSVESSTHSVNSSTVFSSDPASSTVSSSSTIASTSIVSASSFPSPTSVIANGDFEATDSRPWTIRNNAPGAVTYSFVNSNSPHGGSQAGSVAYSAGAGAYQAWFNQPINLQPNTRYNFSGWSRASTANPGCTIVFYIGSADANQVVKTLTQVPSAILRPFWVLSTGFYDTGAIGGALTLNIRWVCSSSAARTYYVDDISLVPT